MNDYRITYTVVPRDKDDDGKRVTTITNINADKAKSTLRSVIPEVREIINCIRISKTNMIKYRKIVRPVKTNKL